MAVASLYPAIKPSLLLDFANTKKLDPRVTFTRSTTAAYYDGVTTAKAEENLLLNSVSPANSSWAWVNGYPGSLGSELVTNGDFSAGTTGFTPSASTLTVVSGELECDISGAGGGFTASGMGSVVSGKTYFITFQYRNGTLPSAVNLQLGNVTTLVPYSATTVQGTFIVTASSTQKFTIVRTGGTGTIYFDDISVKEITPDSVTAPDGTSTASTFTADAANATFTQSVTAVAAEYTFSVYLRRVTGTGNIDIQCGGGTWVTQSITSSWARYTVTQTLTAGTRTPGVRIVTSGDQVEIWGCQLEQRSSVTAYTPTTTQPITNYIPVLLTAPANAPRFDHAPADNPTTGQKAGESLGLLIEEQRTNLLLRSQEFDTTWATTNAAVTANAVVAPNGTLTAEKLIADATNNVHYVGQSVATTAITYTMTVYAKAAEYSFVRLFIDGSGNAYYNLATGALGTVGAGMTASITSVGNGWYRCSLSGVPQVASTSMRVYVANADNVAAYTGDGWSGIYIWGAQLETGAFPTSYIPTTSATVTRNADVASMTGTNFSSWYNTGEGTVYSEHSQIINTDVSIPFALLNTANTTISSSILLFDNGQYRVRDAASSTQALLSMGAPTVNSFSKFAVTFKTNDFAASKDAGAVLTDTTGTVPSIGLFQLAPTPSGYTQTVLHFKKIAYYPQRLTNAQLQALTA